jgi:uncharacterized protein with PQ loop repeat
MGPYFGWIGAIIGFLGITAQFLRVTRRGVDGVSLATWSLFLLSGSFWIAYGMVVHSWEISIGSLINLPQQFSVICYLRFWKHWWLVMRCVGFVALFCVLPTLTWGWAGGAYGAGVVLAVTRGPQLIELVRYEDATGVSVWSWALATIGAASWIAYYVGVRLWAALTAMACALLANLIIALLASWRHRQRQVTLMRETAFG